jgi:hypothetical protein
VAEKLRFEKPLGKLGEVDGDQVAGKAFAETVPDRIEGDEAGPPDGSRGGPFAGPGFAEEQDGKILHAVP